jgi:hypothetical protein
MPANLRGAMKLDVVRTKDISALKFQVLSITHIRG